MIFLYVMFGLLATAFTMVGVNSRRHHGVGFWKYNSLSKPSRNILTDYWALPKDSRPVPNLYSTLRDLDDRFDKDKVSDHFVNRNRFDGTWSLNWYCHANNYNSKCHYGPYHALHDSIEKVAGEVASNKQTLALARASQGNEMALEVASRLEDEANILRDVRKELT